MKWSHVFILGTEVKVDAKYNLISILGSSLLVWPHEVLICCGDKLETLYVMQPA